MTGGLVKKPDPNEGKKYTVDEARSILRSHPVIYEIRSFNDVFTDSVPIEDKVKRRMAVAFLHILWSVTDDIVTDIIDNYEKYCQNSMDLTSMIFEKSKMLTSRSLEEGIPRVFMHKINVRMNEDLSTLTRTLNDLHTVHNYSNSVDETLAILDVILLHIRHTYSAIVGIIDIMNGELQRALSGSIFDQ